MLEIITCQPQKIQILRCQHERFPDQNVSTSKHLLHLKHVALFFSAKDPTEVYKDQRCPPTHADTHRDTHQAHQLEAESNREEFTVSLDLDIHLPFYQTLNWEKLDREEKFHLAFFGGRGSSCTGDLGLGGTDPGIYFGSWKNTRFK